MKNTDPKTWMTVKEAKEILGGDWAKLDKTMGDYREAKGFLEGRASLEPVVRELTEILKTEKM